MSRLFVVDGERSTPASATTLSREDLEERRHLQEWVVENPQVLGEDVLIVCIEYDQWVADIDGARVRGRFDVLGIERTGRLVVAELKRDDAGRDTHLQAITYAGFVARFDPETLVDAHASFLSRRTGSTVAPEDARARLLQHIDGDFDPAILKRPRLVLIASSFPTTVTNTVVWLSEQGLDISLVQYAIWRVGGQVVAEFSVLYPSPVEERFTLGPRRHEADAAEERIEQRTRTRKTVRILLESGVPPVGARLRIAPNHGTNAEIRGRIERWLDADEDRRWVEWGRDAALPLRWRADAADYSASGLADQIFTAVEERSVPGIQGTQWFVLDDEDRPEVADQEQWAELQGKSLVEIARAVGPDRRAQMIDRLLADDLLVEGQELTVVVPQVRLLDVPRIRAWLSDDPRRARVHWRQDRDAPLKWSYDEQAWGAKNLVREIVGQSTGVATDKVWWPRWFVDADDRALNKIADDAL